jgi:D-alanine-D-alanine ligase
MAKKLKVAILFGGRSAEHNISLLSAKNVIDAIDRDKFDPVLIGIDKSGKWHYNEGALKIVNAEDPRLVSLNQLNAPIMLSQNAGEHSLVSTTSHKTLSQVDVIFPVLHGTFGEDGSVQGLAKLANLPCVGCGILGSAIGMDKDVTKRLLRDADIGVADFVTLRRGFNQNMTYGEISKKLGHELFIKPANLGSSVGVSYVKNEKEFNKAVKVGFQYDPKVVVEEKLVGREIECAVMGNDDPQASTIGEVIPKSEWYSFESKYIDSDGAKCQIPASLDNETIIRAQKLAVRTYRLLECEGLTRVDMFLLKNGKLVVNEINTIPGFTKISMYPQLWEASGLSYRNLITKLINYAIEAHTFRNNLKNT